MWKLLTTGQKISCVILLPLSYWSIYTVNQLINLPNQRWLEMIIAFISFFGIPLIYAVGLGFPLAYLIDLIIKANQSNN